MVSGGGNFEVKQLKVEVERLTRKLEEEEKVERREREGLELAKIQYERQIRELGGRAEELQQDNERLREASKQQIDEHYVEPEPLHPPGSN